jgi:isopenicillin-N N-acyltransferase-like protein
MKILFPILFLSFFFLQTCQNNSAKEHADSMSGFDHQEVKMLADSSLRFLELSGTPYERGLAHGKLLAKEIKEVIQLFKEDIQQTTNENPDEFIAKFLTQTDYKSSVQKWMPELMEELRGISEGSGVDIETIFMHQLGDEYWFNTQDILAHNCSSFGVNKSQDQPSIAAQNMDIPPYYHGFQTVIKVKEPQSDMVMMFLTIPGHLGITGMNNQGVSINCNTLMQLDYGKTGLPVTFVVRGVVGKDTQEEALAFLNDIKHASGQNYIIGGPEKVFSMECSANEVVGFRPFEGSSFTYHTNYPMSNTDFSSKYLGMLEKANKTPEEGLYECQRIQSFQKRFTQGTERITIEDIQEVLRSRDHDGRDVVSNANTYASVIYELSKQPRFIIAPGKPHETTYIEIPVE